LPVPPAISSQLAGVTDPRERGRIKAQGLVAHVTWVEKKLPFSWTTGTDYIVTVHSVEYEDPAFKVVVTVQGPAEQRTNSDGVPYEYRPIVWVDNPVKFFNPPILLGGSLVENPVAVAKTIIEQTVVP
jgi:hypothetical protein